MPTKPKKYKNSRITSPGARTQKRGRPKGTRLKRKFEETKLGFMLKHETPLEYDLIIQSTKKTSFTKPDILIIEAICEASDDKSFQKPKFKRYLEEYREHGIHCDRPKKLTPEREMYYKKLRASKIREYLTGRKRKIKSEIKKNIK